METSHAHCYMLEPLGHLIASVTLLWVWAEITDS